MAFPFPRPPVALASCTLETLSRDDAARLGALLAAIDPWRTLGLPEDSLTRALSRDDPAVARYLVRAGDRDAGVVVLRGPWLRGPFLELLAVFEPFQRRGLGREVIAWIAGTAVAAAPNLWATVSSFNARARAFYATLGFREVAVLPDLIVAGHDEVLLRLPLPLQE